MQRSMKLFLVLLWGIFCWCPSVTMTMTPQTPENNMHTTNEPQKTTQQLLINSNVENKTQTHPTHTPAGAEVATQETEKAVVTRSASDDRTSDMAATENTAAVTTGSSGGRLLHSSAAVTTAEAKSPNNMKNGAEHATVDQQSSTASTNKATPSTNISETATPEAAQPRQQSATTSNNKSTPSAATPTASVATTAPMTQSASSAKATTKIPPTTSSTDFTQTPLSTHNQSSPSASTKATSMENTTSGTAPTTVDKSTTGTLASPSSPPTTKIASTSTPERTTARSNTEPPTTSTTDNATSPAGVLIPKDSKTQPTQTTKSPKATTKSPPTTDPQHCSTRHLVKQSLIAIASLGTLATIFMVSTIVLCTKLSSRKYRMKRPRQDTEMMCISSLLPERNYNCNRYRNPPSNGVLVMHTAGDSDDEGGDNLTLSSFLPDNDRLV